jgi:hypothetical protein
MAWLNLRWPPRLAKLMPTVDRRFLDAIGGVTIGHDSDGFWYMLYRLATTRLRLDQILFPPGTPRRALEDLGPEHGAATT